MLLSAVAPFAVAVAVAIAEAFPAVAVSSTFGGFGRTTTGPSGFTNTGLTQYNEVNGYHFISTSMFKNLSPSAGSLLEKTASPVAGSYPAVVTESPKLGFHGRD